MVDTSKIPLSRFSDENFDDVPKSGSSNIISSGAVYNALEEKLGKTDTAAKALKDSDGNIINETYLKIDDSLRYEYEEE